MCDFKCMLVTVFHVTLFAFPELEKKIGMVEASKYHGNYASVIPLSMMLC